MRVAAERASERDLEALIRLDASAREHLSGLRGGITHLLSSARPEPAGPSLSADLDDPACCVLVGRIGDAAVGYATARVVELRDGSSIADIAELYVEPDARGVGVGAAMLEQLTDWATASECSGLDARVMPGDRASKNFFESFGMVARAITVHRELGTP